MSWRSLRARLERLERRRGADLNEKCPDCGQPPYVIRFHEFGEWEAGEQPPCSTCRDQARASGWVSIVCIRRDARNGQTEPCAACDEVLGDVVVSTLSHR
jgi:hypothetical protein